jgi:hypothetical protein
MVRSPNFLRLRHLIRRQVCYSLRFCDHSWPGRCSPHWGPLYAEPYTR